MLSQQVAFNWVIGQLVNRHSLCLMQEMQGGKVNQVNIVLLALEEIEYEKVHDNNAKTIREKHMKFTTNYMLNGLGRDS